MTFLDLVPYLLLLLKGLLILVAVVFFVSGLDDFFIDMVHLVRSVYRRLFVLPKYERLTEQHLRLPREQLGAILIPAWQEAEIIERTLENMLRSVDYANFHIFVGTYRNDQATQDAVDLVAARHDHVHKVVCPRDGPTSKADCLNWIYQGCRSLESGHEVRFEFFVLHDAEDIPHPLSLKLFNYLIPRKDMIQLPVFPLEPGWCDLTAGHYLDEFAEGHSKELVVREWLSHVVPGAGVGCAFSRRALKLVASEHRNEPFNLDSLTEDYDFAFRLREEGGEIVFVVQALSLTRVRRPWFGGKARPMQAREIIATREYFPRKLGQAVRQKSRWILGIVFQGWASLGWRGSGWTKYMLLRDRKAVVTNQISMLGYLVLLCLVTIWVVPRLFPEAYRYPPLVRQGTWLWYLILADTFFLGYRIIARAFYVNHVYGPLQAALSLPRQIWANVVNFLAVCRAIGLFSIHLVTGRKLAWEKTDHRFPSEKELSGFRRKLGDLLIEQRHINREQLREALTRQQNAPRPLGAILMDMGLVDEDTLIHVLGTQVHLSTREVDPYQVPLDVLRVLPRNLAVRHSVFPVEITAESQLLVAVERPLEYRVVGEIEAEIGRPVVLCLTTGSEVSFAIQRGYERLEREAEGAVAGSLLGERLLARGLVDAEQLAAALKEQHRTHARLGDVLVEEGILEREVLRAALEEYSRIDQGHLGAFLVQNGYVSLEQLQRSLDLQRSRFRRLGEILVERGVVPEDVMRETLEEAAP